jgi:fluoroquinolone transport system permease protein
MNRFYSLLKLDILLIVRNRILLIIGIISALYALILGVIPTWENNYLIIALIFSDPVMIGFLFTGVMVLFERSGNTLQALSVSPVRPDEYLWSKAITLSVIATAAATVMALAGKGYAFNLLALIPAVLLTSVLFVFIGFAGVSRVKTFNQYFIFIPLYFIPALLPFLGFFGIYHTPFWYLIPTHASLILFRAAFDGLSEIAPWEIIYSIIYLPLCIWLALLWARQCWMKIITQ